MKLFRRNGTVRRVVKISLNPCDNRLRSIKTTSCEARIVVSFEIEKNTPVRESTAAAHGSDFRKQENERARNVEAQI